MRAIHPTVQRVIEAGAALGLAIEVREVAESAATAEGAAAALGCELARIVKSLLFLADGEPVLALVSGANRLDERKLAALTGVARKRVRRADAATAREATGFAIGGVAPFGHPRALPVYLDRDLLAHATVWAAAGTPRALFEIEPGALARATGARVADLRAERS